MVEGELIVIDEVFILDMLDKLIFLLSIQLLGVHELAHFVYDDPLVALAYLIQVVLVLSNRSENIIFAFSSSE